MCDRFRRTTLAQTACLDEGKNVERLCCPVSPEARLQLSFQADLVLINLQQNGSLKKSHGENKPQRLLEPNDDADHTRQHAFLDSYPLAHLKKWKWLKRKFSFDGRSQGNDFRF